MEGAQIDEFFDEGLHGDLAAVDGPGHLGRHAFALAGRRHFAVEGTQFLFEEEKIQKQVKPARVDR